MSSLSAIRTALVSTVTTAIADLRGYATVPEQVALPAFLVEPATCDYVISMGDDATWELDLIVLVSRVDSPRGQDQLDELISPYGSRSIRKVIFGDCDLGLPDTDATVTGMKGYGATFTVGGVAYIGAILRVSVTTGSA